MMIMMRFGFLREGADVGLGVGLEVGGADGLILRVGVLDGKLEGFEVGDPVGNEDGFGVDGFEDGSGDGSMLGL